MIPSLFDQKTRCVYQYKGSKTSRFMLTKSTCHANIGQITLKIPLSTAPSVILQNSTELPRHAALSARTLGTGASLQLNDYDRGAPAALQSCNAVVNRATCRKRRSPPSRSHLAGGRRAVQGQHSSACAPGRSSWRSGRWQSAASPLSPRQITAECNKAQLLRNLGWATVACGGSKNKRRERIESTSAMGCLIYLHREVSRPTLLAR